MSSTVFIGSYVPSDLASAVRERARNSDRSVSSAVRLALRDWVASPTAATAVPGSALVDDTRKEDARV